MFTRDEALVVFATIKEVENLGVNVDYIREIGAPILETFHITEDQIDGMITQIKAKTSKQTLK